MPVVCSVMLPFAAEGMNVSFLGDNFCFGISAFCAGVLTFALMLLCCGNCNSPVAVGVSGLVDYLAAPWIFAYLPVVGAVL